MLDRLINLWDRLRSSYWFVPTVMAVAAAGVAIGMVGLDQYVSDDLVRNMGWFYTGGAAGARSLLSAVASSVITVAGVVFSITITALTLASSQFGPRLLRNFMRDLGNQIVLGTFIATFVYCLFVLRTIRDADGVDHPALVPNLSVTFGVVMASASIGVLIYFIHHIARSMQASQVIAAVARDLHDGIDSLFPRAIGHSEAETVDLDRNSLQDLDPTAAESVSCEGDGYLQFVYQDQILELAQECDLVIRLTSRPGHYLVAGTVVASIWPRERVDDGVKSRLRSALSLGSERTPLQDLQFSFDQLVEVALRAMSPGINDPFTAITCIDRLGSALVRLANREFPDERRHDKSGRLRVVAPSLSFESVLDATVPPVCNHAAKLASPEVLTHLRETLAAAADLTQNRERKAAVLRHASNIPTGEAALRA